MRCSIYARYSSDMQKPESIEDQIRVCRKLIQSKGWTLDDGHIYTDYAVTGTDDRRSGYLAMKEAGRSGKWDCLVADDLSRLGRHTVEALTTFDELTDIGVHIFAVSDGIDTSTGNAKLPFYLKSMMNELFLDDLRDKVRRGQAGQILRGYSAGGRVYGYRYTEVLDANGHKDRLGRPDRVGVKIEIDSDQAEVVEQIFQMKSRGLGLKAIVRHLNEKRLCPPRGNARNPAPGTWCTATVGKILRQEKYIGDWTWGKVRWIKNRGTGKRRPIPRRRSEWTLNPRPDLRIVNESLWEQVQAQLSARQDVLRRRDGRFSGSRTNIGRAKYLFSGLLKCGHCGASMIVTNSGRYSAYVCNNYWNRGKTVCSNNRHITRECVERDLLSGLEKRLLDGRILDKLISRLNRKISEFAASQPSERVNLKSEITHHEKEVENLCEFVLRGDSSPRIREILIRSETKLANSRQRLASLGAEDIGLTEIDPEWVRRRVSDLRSLLASHQDRTDIARQQLRGLLGEKIRLIPLVDSRKWVYEAEAILKPGKLLAGYPFHYSEIALRGIEPRFDG